MELVEDPLELVRGDAPADVADVHRRVPVRDGEPDVDRAAGGGVLQRVAHQVAEHLHDAHRVAADVHRLRGQLELDPLAVRAEVAARAGDERHEVGGAHLHLRRRSAFGGGDARREQQVLDEPGQVLGAAADDLEALGPLLRAHRVAAAAQQVGVALDRRDRRAQLVRHGGDEVGLQPLDLPLAR